MPALRRGDSTSKDNLNVFLYDNRGHLKDPYTITFSLYDMVCGQPVLIGAADRLPIKFDIGSYFAPWMIPNTESVGLHKIIWKIKDTATTADFATYTEEFDVVDRLTIVNEDYPEPIKRLIEKLRIKLRDIQPDRDYAFAPPTPENEIAGFTETKRFRWPDLQLVNHIEDASNYVNLYPPATDFDLLTYPRAWEPLMLLEAQVYALNDLAILWAGEEFNYALSGISLDLRRSDKFMSLANQIQTMVDKQLEMAKKRVLCTVGLRQDRYTYSRGASMGPWCLRACSSVWDNDNNQAISIEEAYKRGIKHSYSMDLTTNKLICNDVINIWRNGIQELFKMTLANDYEIYCTKAHKFFNKDKDEIKLEDLTTGDSIYVKNGQNIELVEIKNKEYFGEDETYDMEMK